MEFAGEFETHITIGLDSASGIEALRDWGRENGLKCLHILLERGKTASQPMLTRRGCGLLSGELLVARKLDQRLKASGFTVARVKIEAACTNQDVPQTDSDAANHPYSRYFEHHVKLVLHVQADVMALIELAQKHSAHVSRNALRQLIDGRHERFVTQRCRAIGREGARGKLEALLDALAAHGYQTADVEEEFVVFDSNADIDAGWIEPEVASRV